MEELERQAAWAETFGLPLHLISTREAAELFPPMSTDGVHGAALLPSDGYVDPSQLTMALAKGARQRGRASRPTPASSASTSSTGESAPSKPMADASSVRSS